VGQPEFRDETLNGTRAESVVTDGSYVRAGDDVIVTESRGKPRRRPGSEWKQLKHQLATEAHNDRSKMH
jgi:hypothetical protein